MTAPKIAPLCDFFDGCIVGLVVVSTTGTLIKQLVRHHKTALAINELES